MEDFAALPTIAMTRRAEQMRQLDAGEADSPGGTGDEDRLAGLKPRALDQRVPSGEIEMQDCRSDDKIRLVWKTHTLLSTAAYVQSTMASHLPPRRSDDCWQASVCPGLLRMLLKCPAEPWNRSIGY